MNYLKKFDKSSEQIREILSGYPDVPYAKICLFSPTRIGDFSLSSFSYFHSNAAESLMHFPLTWGKAPAKYWERELNRYDSPLFLEGSKLKTNMVAGARESKNEIIVNAFKQGLPEAMGVLKYGKDIQLNVLAFPAKHVFYSFLKAVGDYASIAPLGAAVQVCLG